MYIFVRLSTKVSPLWVMSYLLWQRNRSMYPLGIQNWHTFSRYAKLCKICISFPFVYFHYFSYMNQTCNLLMLYPWQPCLGGDSKTLMFVNISPDPSSTGESLCSLRFAAGVNACEIGIPRRQTSTRSFDSRLSNG